MNTQQDIAHVERRLAELDAGIAELEGEIQRADAKLRQDLAPELKQLRARRHQTDQRLAQARLQEAESWSEEDLRAGIFQVLDEIGRHVDAVFARVR